MKRNHVLSVTLIIPYPNIGKTWKKKPCRRRQGFARNRLRCLFFLVLGPVCNENSSERMRFINLSLIEIQANKPCRKGFLGNRLRCRFVRSFFSIEPICNTKFHRKNAVYQFESYRIQAKQAMSPRVCLEIACDAGLCVLLLPSNPFATKTPSKECTLSI